LERFNIGFPGFSGGISALLDTASHFRSLERSIAAATSASSNERNDNGRWSERDLKSTCIETKSRFGSFDGGELALGKYVATIATSWQPRLPVLCQFYDACGVRTSFSAQKRRRGFRFS